MVSTIGLSDQYVNLIKDAIALAPEVNLKTPGRQDPYFKLTKTEFKSNIAIGDNVKILVPGEITLFDYKGGALPDAEYPTNTNITVTVKEGKGFRYAMNNVQANLINAKPQNEAMPFIKEHALNVSEKFLAGIVKDLAALYPDARFNLNASLYPSAPTTSIMGTQTNIFRLFARMADIFQQGYTLDGVERIPWQDGKMIAVIPPLMQSLITSSTRFQYTTEGFKATQKGYIGELAGWSLYTSPYVPRETVTIGGTDYTQYHPLFGVEGESLGAIIAKELSTMQYIDPNSFDNVFKGYGLHGEDMLRADKTGTAAVILDETLGT